MNEIIFVIKSDRIKLDLVQILLGIWGDENFKKNYLFSTFFLLIKYILLWKPKVMIVIHRKNERINKSKKIVIYFIGMKRLKRLIDM